ncbi:MAG: DUF4153 domain-containing protein [Candidatus Roizmanbacteria bacterium]
MKNISLQSTVTFFSLALWSLLSSWCIVISYTPYVGLWIFFTGLSTFVYLFKKPKYRFDSTLYIFCLVLSAFILLRADEVLLMLNVLGIIFLGSILCQNKTNHLDLLNLFFVPFQTLGSAIITKSEIKFPTIHIKNSSSRFANIDYGKLFLSIVITCILLIIVVPLLASANPLFAKIISTIFEYLNIIRLLNFIFSDGIFQVIFRIVFAFVLFAFTSNLATYAQKDALTTPIKQSETAHIWLIPKIVLILVLSLFFITQLQLYFADANTLNSLDYTRSRMTNEVFSQLSIVSLIIFALLFLDRHHSRISRISTYILIILGGFLTFVAFKSDFDYSNAWGITHKRLYGFTVVFWLVIAYILYSHKYFKNIVDSTFLKQIVLLTAGTLFLINVLNFDNLIYNVSKSHTHKGIDYVYLSQLSSDAGAWKNIASQIDTIIDIQEKNNTIRHLIQKANILESKYRRFDARIFNLAEFIEYQDIKNIDLEKLENKQRSIDNKFFKTYPIIDLNN